MERKLRARSQQVLKILKDKGYNIRRTEHLHGKNRYFFKNEDVKHTLVVSTMFIKLEILVGKQALVLSVHSQTRQETLTELELETLDNIQPRR